MAEPSTRFALPAQLDGDLARALSAWTALKRAENPMPFADDVTPTTLSSPDDAVLLTVFRNPLRFRLDRVGTKVTAAFGRDLTGRFADEFALHAPFEEFEAQCQAAAAGKPTYHRSPGGQGRLVLPFWGDGHVSNLVAVLQLA